MSVILVLCLILESHTWCQNRLHQSSGSPSAMSSLLRPIGTHSVIIAPSFEPECCLSVSDSTISLIYPNVNIAMFLYSRQKMEPRGESRSSYPENISLTKKSLCVGSIVVAEIESLIDAAIMTSATYESVPTMDGTSYLFFSPSGKSAYCGNILNGNCSDIADLFEDLVRLVKSESCKEISERIPVMKELTSRFRRLGAMPSQGNASSSGPVSRVILPVFTEDNDFSSWVNKRLVYPKEMVDNKIEGTVLLSFTILKDGTLADIDVLSSPHQVLTDLTVNIVKSSPSWKPGLDRESGQPVDCKISFPVIFKLGK